MIKLAIIGVIALVILGAIVYYIFKPGSPLTNSKSILNPNHPAKISLSDIKIDPAKVKPTPKPIFAYLYEVKASSAYLYAPKQSSPSGYVRLSEVTGKILIQLKSDSTLDKIGFIYEGSCQAQGEIVYPLASLKEGKSQTIWETNMEGIQKSLPLSIKVFKDAKNLNTFTRCADLKMP